MYYGRVWLTITVNFRLEDKKITFNFSATTYPPKIKDCWNGTDTNMCLAGVT